MTFTAPGRDMAAEDRIVLTSVGVDIGSSTSHLLFSQLELERADNRYVTVRRDVLHQSDILLTPYRGATTIDDRVLHEFVEAQYAAAGLTREAVDTGALILTGVALLRENARAIAELFAAEAGRFVAVSAGDNLEATMAAHGSGAVALSETQGDVMNVDIGGGTTKVVICRKGRTAELMAMDVGARLIATSADGTVTRLEPAAADIAQRLGINVSPGQRVAEADLRRIAEYMVDQLLAEIGHGATHKSHLLRTAPLGDRNGLAAVTFSGGVSEFIYDRAQQTFGDLGSMLAEELRRRAGELPAHIVPTAGGIRATVIGASQYTIQVSGSTIYLAPLDVVPVRNVPVVAPQLNWDPLSSESVAAAVGDALRRFDLVDASTPVAIAARWEGSATYKRINAFCLGAIEAMRSHVDKGHPLILVFDSDIGGLLGLHVREEMRLDVPVISIDGVELREFDYIDIGALIASSGAVPVVIKSLVFPHAAQG
jgi:ethanolamine utilization protein EutA (predicted chaperonin)